MQPWGDAHPDHVLCRVVPVARGAAYSPVNLSKEIHSCEGRCCSGWWEVGVPKSLSRGGCVGVRRCRDFSLRERKLLFRESTQLFFGPEESLGTRSKAFSRELHHLIAHCFQNHFLLFVSSLPLLVSSHFNNIREKNTYLENVCFHLLKCSSHEPLLLGTFCFAACYVGCSSDPQD